MKATPSVTRMPPHDCTILVCSCDAYGDLWRPFFTMLDRYWPDRPFEVVLVSETNSFRWRGVTTVLGGRGLQWSDLLLHALRSLETESVLFMLDDFILRHAVNTAMMLELLRLKREHRLDMLRVLPRPGPSLRPTAGLPFGLISSSAAYRVSTQAAFWTRSTLIELLRPGETIWEFEVAGTLRSRSSGRFASTINHALPYYHHSVQRGRWFPWAARRLARHGVSVDLDARPLMAMPEVADWTFKKFVLGPVLRLMRG
jgi:hypothetical protein